MPSLQILVQHSKMDVLHCISGEGQGSLVCCSPRESKRVGLKNNIINKLKKKSHVTLSTDAEIAGDKIQNPSMIKTFSKLRIEIKLPQFGKEYLPKKKPSTANIILNGEKLETFLLRSGLTRWHSFKESASKCRRHKRCGFDPCGEDPQE